MIAREPDLDAGVLDVASIAGGLLAGVPLMFTALGETISERGRRAQHRPRGDDAARRLRRASSAPTTAARVWLGYLRRRSSPAWSRRSSWSSSASGSGSTRSSSGSRSRSPARGSRACSSRPQFGTTLPAPRRGADGLDPAARPDPRPRAERQPLQPAARSSTSASPASVCSAWSSARTNIGLNLRAAGEKPEALDAAGVSVVATRSYAVLATGALAGLGGAYLAIVGAGIFTPFITQGQGFMAIVIAMLARGRPLLGRCSARSSSASRSRSSTSLQLAGINISTDVVNMLPFAAIIVALIAVRAPRLPAARRSRCPTCAAPARKGDPMRDPDFTLTAGPTTASPRVLAALGSPIIYHYDPVFLERFRRDRAQGRPSSSGRANDVLLMQGEAVLGLEAAARALVRPGHARAQPRLRASSARGWATG